MENKEGMLKVGDKVMWRGSFGQDKPKEATIVSIQITEGNGEKYGTDVDEVLWNLVLEDRVVLDLAYQEERDVSWAENGVGHAWAYGYQIVN